MSPFPGSKTAEDPKTPAMGQEYFLGGEKGKGNDIGLVADDGILK